MIRILQSLLLIIPLTLAGTLFAQDTAQETELKYYDVEIIVFKNDKVPRAHELNLPTPSASQTENTLDLSNTSSISHAKTLGYTPLKPEELRLLDKVNGIINSSRYSLLLHTGWRQPGTDEENSIPVWVRGGKVYSNSYFSIDSFQEVNPGTISDSANGAQTAAAEGQIVSAKGLYELEGKITITLSRYLHTHAQLVLRKPATPMDMLQQGTNAAQLEEAAMDSIEGQLLLNYGLNEKRRMRSKRLHYLDSPEFGILVLITPYEPPQPAEPATAEDAGSAVSASSTENG